jgi:hypothetical protein
VPLAVFNHVQCLLSQTPTCDEVPVIPGNETADVEGNLAAMEGGRCRTDQPPSSDSAAANPVQLSNTRVLLISIANRRVRRRIRETRARDWVRVETGKSSRRLTPVSDKTNLRLLENLLKP